MFLLKYLTVEIYTFYSRTIYRAPVVVVPGTWEKNSNSKIKFKNFWKEINNILLDLWKKKLKKTSQMTFFSIL
jgi:hypothetical protein